AGQPRRALGVGHQLALAVATPAPVVERAGDLVALDGALRQVATHVPAVAVQDLQVARGVREHREFGAEDLHAVRLAVQEILHGSQAVPAAGVAVGQGAGVDLANAAVGCFSRHFAPPVSLTRTRYSFDPGSRNDGGVTCGIPEAPA